MDKRRIELEIRAVQVSYRDAIRQRGDPRIGDVRALRLRAVQLLDAIDEKIGSDGNYDLRRQLAEARREVQATRPDAAAHG
jgi:hypothetical protein